MRTYADAHPGRVHAVVAIGEASDEIAHAFYGYCVERATSMREAVAAAAGPIGVREADALGTGAGLPHGDEHLGADLLGAGALQVGGRLMQRSHPGGQVVGEQMVQAGQDRDRSLFQTGHAAVDGGAQSEGDGHRLFVTEQQRRQLASAAQLIAPAHAGCGFDGVAEIAEPVDVAAHRPVCHVQPLGQLGARPRGSVLQQGQQRQHPAGTVAHEARRVIVAIPPDSPLLRTSPVRMGPRTRRAS